MPYIWGEFESSLRGSKVSADELKKVLHKTCSGHAHGHGVAKEKVIVEREKGRRQSREKSVGLELGTHGRRSVGLELGTHGRRASLDELAGSQLSSLRGRSLPPVDTNSSDEGFENGGSSPDDIRMPDVIPKSKSSRRATSAGMLSGPASLSGQGPASMAGQINTPRRSSVEVMQRMLYGSATKDDLKNRGGTKIRPTPTLPINHRTRRTSPSMAPYKRRRNSIGSGANSPTNDSSGLNNSTNSGSGRTTPVNGNTTPTNSSPIPAPSTLPRRTKSTTGAGNCGPFVNTTNPAARAAKKMSLGNPGMSYAFGSSTTRFKDSHRLNSSNNTSRESLTGSPNSLCRTDSETRVYGSIGRRKGKQLPTHKNSVAKAWKEYQEDIEAAMRSKPGNSGSYKNLRDLLQGRLSVDDQVCSDGSTECTDSDRVWLVHRDGFTPAHQIGDESVDVDESGEGLINVKLDASDDVIQVEEDDVERANPSNFDKVEDLAQLRYLNESSVLHTLCQRYKNNLTYTFAGPSLISLNPCTDLPIYSEKIIQMFKECRLEDTPPHIYSLAKSAHRTMLFNKKDQSVAFLGRTGSGKSTNFRHFLSYLSTVGPGSNGVLTPDKVQAVTTVLDSFGSCRTGSNMAATKFSQIFSVDFDRSGAIVSASIQAMMLERWRVVCRADNESNFKIFYQMLNGLDSKSKREHLLDSNESSCIVKPLQRQEEWLEAAAGYNRLTAAIKKLGINSSEWRGVLSVLAGICHLGSAGVAQRAGRPAFNKQQSAQKAAHCLGIPLEDLTQAVFQGSKGSSSTVRRNSRVSIEMTTQQDFNEALECFIVSLYSDLFNVVVSLVNRNLVTGAETVASILAVDTPGFQNPAQYGRMSGANFEELCQNYTQERLQQLFHSRSITQLRERYEDEGIDIPNLSDLTELITPEPLVQLIDKQSTLRTSQSDLSQLDKRGLLWILDEESIYPGSGEANFTERLLQEHIRTDRPSSGNDDLIKPGPDPTTFTLRHLQGTNPVMYNTSNWLKMGRENIICKQASNLLIESQDKNVTELFSKYRNGNSTMTAGNKTGSIPGTEGNLALRRASSIRRAFTSSSAGLKRHSSVLQCKFQTDSIIEQLRRTKIKFVHCYLPQQLGGLCEDSQVQLELATLDIPLVRAQLRGSQILDAVRLHKVGFPENIHFKDFNRRFSILGEGLNLPEETTTASLTSKADLTSGDSEVKGHAAANLEVLQAAKRKTTALLSSLEMDPATYKLGNTQVFLRSGVLIHLEEGREDRLKHKILRLQAACRGFLARKHFQKLKTQDIAIRCIQKNVRKFIGVRDWQWWRLLVKVSPLLNVERTEEKLNQSQQQLEALKQRLEKVEKERKEFKETAETAQARLSEMTADLAEEQSASALATQRLETEQAERMKLEREKQDLTNKNKTLNLNSERMEMELLSSRAMEFNGMEDDDADTVYRAKYARAMKELEHAKKLLNQQHEDDLEQLMALKKQLEKKLHDAYEEVEEQRQVVVQWKKKTHKIQGEMNDTRLLLEEQTSRNQLLEKKQRKFDSELNLIEDERKQDKLAKDKLTRDLEQLKQTKNRLEEQIQSLKHDGEAKDDKINSLNSQLTDLQLDSTSEDEVRALKKSKKDLEMQLKDQEEELDDLAAQVQMLEASRTKLEMEMAAIKKEHRRECVSKEEEIEEARASANKKVKILEQQLEQEHEERIMFLRERHDLEQKISTLQDMLERSGDEEQVAKLKKDLKKTKALLRDAQTLVEKNQNEGTNKVILRQLKNQLEDAEFARTAAMKARQNAEMELSDTQAQYEELSRNKQDLEDKYLRISREKAELGSQLNENEEEMQEVMRKYRASVAAVSTDQITIQDQQTSIQELENERNKLRDSVAELQSKLGNIEGDNVSTATHKRLELKVRELESKLDLEGTNKTRLETQISRLKEQIDKLVRDNDDLRVRDQVSAEAQRKLSRQLRDVKEEFSTLQVKETELSQKKFDLEKQFEVAEAETLTVKSDLKLAQKRIEDLSAALAGDVDSADSEDNSDSSDEEMSVFLEHHRRAMSVQRERESMARESVLRDSILRESVGCDSMARESIAREIRAGSLASGRTFSSIDETKESITVDTSANSSATIQEVDESQA